MYVLTKVGYVLTCAVKEKKCSFKYALVKGNLNKK